MKLRNWPKIFLITSGKVRIQTPVFALKTPEALKKKRLSAGTDLIVSVTSRLPLPTVSQALGPQARLTASRRAPVGVRHSSRPGPQGCPPWSSLLFFLPHSRPLPAQASWHWTQLLLLPHLAVWSY